MCEIQWKKVLLWDPNFSWKMFSESEWFFFLFPGEFFLKIKFNSFFFAICETQWKRKFRIFFFTLKTKFLRGKIKSPERKGKRMFSNAWKRIKKNLEKIICETEWNRRFEGSHIFPGNCIFLSHVWKQMKKKNPYKVSPERKKVLAGNPNFTRNCFFFQTKFSFVFFCVKQSKQNGLGRRTTFFPSKWKKKLFWGNVAFHWWKIKFWPENLFFFQDSLLENKTTGKYGFLAQTLFFVWGQTKKKKKRILENVFFHMKLN